MSPFPLKAAAEMFFKFLPIHSSLKQSLEVQKVHLESVCLGFNFAKLFELQFALHFVSS